MQRHDHQLVSACLKGEGGAWNELVDRYGRLVYSVPRRYGLADAECEDVFQGVFVALFRKLETLRESDRLSSWLITCAHRESWRVGKQASRHRSFEDAIVDVSSPGQSDLVRWETQDMVRAGLRELGGPCEQLLTALFQQQGAPEYHVVAEQLGLPVGSIGPTRARCFEKLKPILLRLGLRPPGQASVRRDGEQ